MAATILANHRTCGIKITDKFLQTSNGRYENLRQFLYAITFLSGQFNDIFIFYAEIHEALNAVIYAQRQV